MVSRIVENTDIKLFNKELLEVINLAYQSGHHELHYSTSYDPVMGNTYTALVIWRK